MVAGVALSEALLLGQHMATLVLQPPSTFPLCMCTFGVASLLVGAPATLD